MNATRSTGTLIFDTSWGWMGIAASDRGIWAVILPLGTERSVQAAMRQRGLRRDGRSNPWNGAAPASAEVRSTGNLDVEHLLVEGKDQLTAYLEGRSRTLELPVDLSCGTVFQRRVWRAIERIPYGRVRSYGWVAAKVGGRQYARAVGRALGANPVPIVIPCHRILAAGGALGGFTGGVRTKRRLLSLEGIEGFTAPSERRATGR